MTCSGSRAREPRRNRQRHPHHQLLPSEDVELVIGPLLFPLVIVSHGGSLLYPSSGDSRCFLSAPSIRALLGRRDVWRTTPRR